MATEYAQLDRSTLQETAVQAENAMNSLRASLDNAVGTLTERTREAARYADRTVQNNPWSSVGVAFGVGVVFGALITFAVGSQRSVISRYF